MDKRTPHDVIREFITRDIRRAKNVIILWDDGTDVFMDQSEMTHRESVFLSASLDAQVKVDLRKGN